MVAVAVADLADGTGEPGEPGPDAGRGLDAEPPPAGRALVGRPPAVTAGDARADPVARAEPGTPRLRGLAPAPVPAPVSAEETGARPRAAVSWAPGRPLVSAIVSSVAAATAKATATPAAKAAWRCRNCRRRARRGPAGIGKPRCIQICNRTIA
jgi:hypothetical protein